MELLANIPTNIIGFVIVLGVLVFAHESAHFLAAKAFGVRVLVYSFGFGKRLFGFEYGGTDYRVSLIPLGGYVKMAGDETDDDAAGAADELPSRPRWQRFLILLAGPLANAILAIVFMMMFLMMGTQVLESDQPVLADVTEGGPAAVAGMQRGDRVVSVDGGPIETWDDLRLAVGTNAENPIEIVWLREGERFSAVIEPERVLTELGSAGRIGIVRWLDPKVGEVTEGSAADEAGLRNGDLIVSLDGEPVEAMYDLERGFAEEREQPLNLEVVREGRRVALQLPVRRSEEENWPGFAPAMVEQQWSLGAAFDESLEQNWRMTRIIFVTLGRLIEKPTVKDFSGPLEIARISGQMFRAGFQAMLYLLAVISLNLAILNMIPIPVLDGGQIAILAVEGVMRKDMSLRAKAAIQYAGLLAIVALMVIIIFQDVIRNVRLMMG